MQFRYLSGLPKSQQFWHKFGRNNVIMKISDDNYILDTAYTND